MNRYRLTEWILIGMLLAAFGGCAQVHETAKVIWGSSTRALENARSDEHKNTYRCRFDDCWETVLGLARSKSSTVPRHLRRAGTNEAETDSEVLQEPEQTGTEGIFDIFIKDRKKRHIVVMGITGNVDTTEVGIFFSQPTLTTVAVDISSLSSTAKRKVAQKVFDALDQRFSQANP